MRSLLLGSCLSLLLCACADDFSYDEVVAQDASVWGADPSVGVDLSVPSDPNRRPPEASAGGAGIDAGAGDASQALLLPSNVDFETALRLTPDGHAVLQDQRVAGQTDYFVFEAEPGGLYEISTDRHRFSPDLVVSVYDPERKLLAENDTGAVFAGDAIDARVIIRAETGGDYYVKASDPNLTSTFFTDAPLPLLYYHPRVRRIVEDTPGYAIARPGGQVELRPIADEVTGYRYVTLLGEAGDEEALFQLKGQREDVFAAEFRDDLTLHPDQTMVWQTAQLEDEAAHVLGRIERALGQKSLHPPVSTASYRLRVRPEAAVAGGASLYAVDLVLVPDNRPELDDLKNNTPAGAETVPFSGFASRRGLIRSLLPRGDVDYYRIDLVPMERTMARCEGQSGGSGVRGFKAEIVDAQGAVLQSAVEPLEYGLVVQPTEPASVAGVYYLRLTAAEESSDFAAGDWVRCDVRIGH
ncbi:MAG: hypothetical protein RL385_4561 [Pseudomonadota bacterium]|jgi:hypothetical protein